MPEALTESGEPEHIATADSDLPPAQCLPQSIEAPPMPCAMLGDEAETPLADNTASSMTLCPRCALLRPSDQIKSVTEFSRFLRDYGFSRSAATKIACHGFPKTDGADEGSAEIMRRLQATALSLKSRNG